MAEQQKSDMSEDHQQQPNQEKKPRETTAAFCDRLGIKRNRRQGGMEFAPWTGPPNAPKEPRESIKEFCERLGIKHNTRAGGVEIAPYSGGNLLQKKPKK